MAGALTRLMPRLASCSLFTPPQVVGALTVLMRRRNTPSNPGVGLGLRVVEPWVRVRASLAEQHPRTLSC